MAKKRDENILAKIFENIRSELRPGKIEKTRNAWFGEIFVRSSKISILTFRREVAENQNFGPMGF